MKLQSILLSIMLSSCLEPQGTEFVAASGVQMQVLHLL